jgi:hypothetical protein
VQTARSTLGYFVSLPPGWKGKLVMYLIILAGAFVIVTIGHFVR